MNIWLLKEVEKCGGLTYTHNKMHEFRQKALDGLSELPNGETREALHKLIFFITERNY